MIFIVSPKMERNALVRSFVNYKQRILPAGFLLFIWNFSQTSIYQMPGKATQEHLTNDDPVHYSTTSSQYEKEEVSSTNGTSDIQTKDTSKPLQSGWFKNNSL